MAIRPRSLSDPTPTLRVPYGRESPENGSREHSPQSVHQVAPSSQSPISIQVTDPQGRTVKIITPETS